MRIARMLLLAALAALAAMALTATAATTATAAVNVQAENEEAAGGVNCNNALNNCIIHARGLGVPPTGETQLIRHPFGIVSLCVDEFEGEVLSAAGNGHITHQEIMQGPSQQCNVTRCTGVEGEWPFQIEEEGPVETIQVRFCVLPGGQPPELHCDLEPVITQPTTHHYLITTNGPLTCKNDPNLEVNGRWEVERHPHTVAAHDDIEITHTP